MTAYAEITEVESFLRIEDAAESFELAYLVDAASRVIDTWCDQTFDDADTSATARKFTAQNPWLIEVDAIANTTDFVLATDSSGNGTYDTTWTSSDYQLEPLNQRKSGLTDHPYTQIRAIGSYSFPVGREALVEVTARWGWTSGVPDAVRTACILIVKHVFEERNTLSGVAFGDGTTAFTAGAMTPRVKMLLQPYRRVRVSG